MAPLFRPGESLKNVARPRTSYAQGPSYIAITDSDLESPSPKPSESKKRQYAGDFVVKKLSNFVRDPLDSDSDAPSPKKRKLDRAAPKASNKPRSAPTRQGDWLKATERHFAISRAARKTTTPAGKSRDTADWVLSQQRKVPASSTPSKNLAASTTGGKAAKVRLEISANGHAFVVGGLEAPAAVEGQRTASEGGSDAGSFTMSEGTLEQEDGVSV